MGRVFWKAFLVFRPAHVVTPLGAGVAIWASRPTRFDAGVGDGRMESLHLDEPVGGIAEDVGVEMSDRQPGVAEAELVSIFETFYRGAGAAERGLRLGLSIARSVMRPHRGTVAACNCSCGGLVVSLYLPRG